jgi:Asparagine synthase
VITLRSWHDGVAKVSRYWRLDCTESPVRSISEAAERLRELLLDATKIRMLSERSLGGVGDLLTMVDITTMGCSLEARAPFLDHHLMELAGRS